MAKTKKSIMKKAIKKAEEKGENSKEEKGETPMKETAEENEEGVTGKGGPSKIYKNLSKK